MASRMCMYRADYDVGKEHRVRFFYARNARVGREFCRVKFAENDGKINRLVLKKIGYMKDDVGTMEAAFMKADEETLLVLQDYGAKEIFAEREKTEGDQ